MLLVPTARAIGNTGQLQIKNCLLKGRKKYGVLNARKSSCIIVQLNNLRRGVKYDIESQTDNTND